MSSSLGEGGAGVVLEVTCKHDNSRWAAKIIKARKNITSERGMQKLKTEIGIMQAHKSPYFVHCKESYLWNSNIYIIMELMDLGAITNLVNSDIDYSEQVCRYILNETLKGIAELHARKVIH